MFVQFARKRVVSFRGGLRLGSRRNNNNNNRNNNIRKGQSVY